MIAQLTTCIPYQHKQSTRKINNTYNYNAVLAKQQTPSTRHLQLHQSKWGLREDNKANE